MIRVLRYPRLSALFFAASLGSAMARDACMNAGLEGWAQAFLAATIVALGGALTLFSCRFVVGEWGVGVGFLLHMRRRPRHTCPERQQRPCLHKRLTAGTCL